MPSKVYSLQQPKELGEWLKTRSDDAARDDAYKLLTGEVAAVIVTRREDLPPELQKRQRERQQMQRRHRLEQKAETRRRTLALGFRVNQLAKKHIEFDQMANFGLNYSRSKLSGARKDFLRATETEKQQARVDWESGEYGAVTADPENSRHF